MVALAPNLPFGPAYAAVRGPVGTEAGFAWTGGDADLTTTMDWFLTWLDTEGDPDRPVVLVGFADGATLAAALLVTHPERWAGGVLLHGALPDVPLERGRLTGIPVFLACGTTRAAATTWSTTAGRRCGPSATRAVPGSPVSSPPP